MRRSVDYAERAEQCRRLAQLCNRAEDWAHFLEMAETWEMLLKHQQEKSRSETIALADRVRNVLLLSDEAKRPITDDENEKAA